MAVVVLRSSLMFFFVLVFITYQPEIKSSQGRRLLNLMEKVSHIEGGRRMMMHDSDSSTIVVEKTKLAAGKYYYLDSTQQGHSPGVGHPFVSSKLDDAQEIMKEQITNVAAGKTQYDYSPGVGHSVPATSTDGYGAKSAEAAGGGGAPVLAAKRNAKGKSDDYSPGVGHSDNKQRVTGVAIMQNNKYNVRDHELAVQP